MKLNPSDKERTLYVHELEGHFLLIERERTYNPSTGRNSWYEQRVVLSPGELRKLYENFHTIMGGLKSE